jgi:hypothetical protein
LLDADFEPIETFLLRNIRQRGHDLNSPVISLKQCGRFEKCLSLVWMIRWFHGYLQLALHFHLARFEHDNQGEIEKRLRLHLGCQALYRESVDYPYNAQEAICFL